jgi:hypothetical protein
MRAMILAFVTGLTAAGPACAQNVPFAEPPPASAGQSSTAVLPSLGDIMIDTQLRHIKLWYSAKANNWSLVKFELARITESLRKAAILYRNIPIEFIAAMNKPLTDMTGAAIAGNSGDFNYAYSASRRHAIPAIPRPVFHSFACKLPLRRLSATRSTRAAKSRSGLAARWRRSPPSS